MTDRASTALGDFIQDNLEPILQEWEEFARSLAPLAGMDKHALRDHAQAMLDAVVVDMQEPQSERQRRAKSEGQGPSPEAGLDHAAQLHAVARLHDQFTLDQLVAEFRAIRASVLRRWSATDPVTPHPVEQITRFNEAIDQALSTSVEHYSSLIEESRTVILGVLAHDLRNPLSSITMGMHHLMRSSQSVPETARVAARTLRSAERMEGLVRDLLDFALARLGGGLPVRYEPANLQDIAARVVEEMQSSHPGRVVRLVQAGALDGRWDPARVSQLLINLVTNALQHGDSSGEVRLELNGVEADAVVLAVHNGGPPMSEASRRRLFQPMNRPPTGTEPSAASSGLGLGLYIASQIVKSHKGSLEVSSGPAHGTTFTARLPRQPQQPEAEVGARPAGSLPS
jgi:signal transduction histidine kinase